MKKYTIKALADLAGITVRTLHHYDQIALLRPHERSKTNGYRYYGPAEALRLQQILFYRELDYPLEQIQRLLDGPKFDLKASLEFQRAQLKKQAKRIKNLLHTVDQTLYQLNHHHMLKDDQLYAGFNSVEEGKALTEEAKQRWGTDEVQKSQDRVRQLSPEQWQKVKDEGDAITQKLADLMGRYPADSQEVQNAIELFHKHLENFYPVSLKRLSGLGKMYVEDERFRAFYDKYKKDLSDFIHEAIEVYCERQK